VNFLLDTNAVSEWVKPRPNPGLIGWMESADEDRIFLSVISLAELRYGVERIAAGRRRSRLEQWLQHELPLRFEGRILPVDTTVRKPGVERRHAARRRDVGWAQWMLSSRQPRRPIK
jgi:predicted nucleic acid-binding protein